MKFPVFWDVMPYGMLEVKRRMNFITSTHGTKSQRLWNY
jgi:hypothetical protein